MRLYMFKSQFISVTQKKKNDHQGHDYQGGLFYSQSSFNLGNSLNKK